MSAPRPRPPEQHEGSTCVYLIRHGTPVNVAGRCIGHCDVELSAQGRDEMRNLARSLAPTPNLIITSDLVRAYESAEVLAAIWRVPVQIEPRLRELDFGEWDGRTWDDIHARDGARMAYWSADWVNRPPPGGESFATFATRVREWLRDPALPGHGADTAVVTHAGVIRAIMSAVRGVPLERALEIDAPYGGLAGVVRLSTPHIVQEERVAKFDQHSAVANDQARLLFTSARNIR